MLNIKYTADRRRAAKKVFWISFRVWLNSSGIGTVISAMTTLRNAGGHLKMAAVPEKIMTILTVTKLTTVLEIYPTVQAAVQSF
jgi:anti-sigma B factor antagonist